MLVNVSRLVTVEEHSIIGGLGDAVMDVGGKAVRSGLVCTFDRFWPVLVSGKPLLVSMGCHSMGLRKRF